MSAQSQEEQVQATKPATTLILKKPGMAKLVTSKEQILMSSPDIFEGIGRFSGSPYQIQVDPWIPMPVHLKEALKKEVDKMLKEGIIKPIHEAIPWINSFILIEGKDKLGNLKLCIYLDPTNLNKAVISESYHFNTLKDIAHLMANSCVMMACNCKKGYWHQELDEASFFLTTFNTELGRFRYTDKLFGITVTGDIFQ